MKAIVEFTKRDAVIISEIAGLLECNAITFAEGAALLARRRRKEWQSLWSLIGTEATKELQEALEQQKGQGHESHNIKREKAGMRVQEVGQWRRWDIPHGPDHGPVV